MSLQGLEIEVAAVFEKVGVAVPVLAGEVIDVVLVWLILLHLVNFAALHPN